MPANDSMIKFHCGYCGKKLSVPEALEGRSGRCPGCSRAIQIPAAFPDHPFLIVDDGPLQPRRFRGLLQGAAASVLLHVVLLLVLGAIYVQVHEVGRSIIISLLTETEPVDEDQDLIGEMPEITQVGPDQDSTFQASEFIGAGSQAGTPMGLGVATGTGRTTKAAPLEIANTELESLGRFSSAVVDRLAGHPEAKGGVIEIALYWDGPSDLDLHVKYTILSRTEVQMINYQRRGTPTTGYLDVDANINIPFVDTPIEHIRWETKPPAAGTYRVMVHGYRLRSRGQTPPTEVPFTVEIKTPDGLQTYQGVATQDKYSDVETLAFGMPQIVATDVPDRILENAKHRLAKGDKVSKEQALESLKRLRRAYPKSAAAEEARELIEANKPN